MAKPKFKIGTLVETKMSDDTSRFDTINGVLTHNEGHRYILGNDEPNESVTEDSIVTAYREIKPREKKTSIQRARSKSKKTAKSDEATVN